MSPETTEECQNQVIDQPPVSPVSIEEAPRFFYCLIFKEYLDTCPSQCPYFIAGAAIPIEFLYEHNFEIECPHLYLLVQTPQTKKQFICGKTGETPNPQECD